MFNEERRFIPIASSSNLQFQPIYNRPSSISNNAGGGESFCCDEPNCLDLIGTGTGGMREGGEICGEECPDYLLNWDLSNNNNNEELINCEGCFVSEVAGTLTNLNNPLGQGGWNTFDSFTSECCTEDCFESTSTSTSNSNSNSTNKIAVLPNTNENIDCQACWDILPSSTSSSLTDSSTSGAETPAELLTGGAGGNELEFGEMLKGLDEEALQNILDCCCCGIDGQQLQQLDPTISSHYPNLNLALPPTSNPFPSRNSFAIPSTSSSSHSEIQHLVNSFPCKWAGCELLFRDKAGLVSHVNEEHLFLPSPDKIKVDSKCLWDDCGSGLNSMGGSTSNFNLNPQLNNNTNNNSSNNALGLIPPTIAETLQQLPAPTSVLLQHLLQAHLEQLSPAQNPYSLLPPISNSNEPILPLTLPTPYQHQHILPSAPHQHLTVDPSHSHSHLHHPHSHSHSHEHSHPHSIPIPVTTNSNSNQKSNSKSHSHTHPRPKPHRHTHPYGVRPLKALQPLPSHSHSHHSHHLTSSSSYSNNSNSTSISTPKLPSPTPIEPSSESFGCNWKGCSFHFSSTAELMSHLSACHVGFGKSEYRCEWGGCAGSSTSAGVGGKRGRRGSGESDELVVIGGGGGGEEVGGGRCFAQRQKIMRHLQTHTGDRPFVCEICGKSFSEATTLTQHTRTHTAEKPYPCTFPDCSKAFSLASALTIHTRTHTGSKPFSCPHPTCIQSFSESSNLSKHIRTHNGLKPYECEECGRGFARSDQLGRHRGVHERKRRRSGSGSVGSLGGGEAEGEGEEEEDGEGSEEGD